MSKIIKKKFINSLPVFLIISLLGLSVSALVFNFNIEIDRIGDRLGFSVSMPEVEAQGTADVATTTVTVRNAPPVFTVNPAENPSSASTTPVNVGATIDFIATASDAEGNDYYLLVCDQDGATPGALGAAPSCTTGTQLCVSVATTEQTQASCTHTVADLASEIQSWVAYVCDNHPTEPACVENSHSGSGDSGSPFYRNHAPTLTSVSTIVDNQDPGDNFTFEALITDSDIEGGADVLEIDVCSTDVWDLSTGCGAITLCSATSTSPNVSCSWESTIPLAHISYNYYVFAKDWHEMPASGNSQTSTYTVNNVAPYVSSVLINDGNPITLNIKGNTTTVYASSTTITDNNGCQDIESATATIYWSDATGAANCAADDNDCYQITSGSCTIDASTCTGPTDVDVSVQCSADLAYHAIPTVVGDSNPHGGTSWMASIRAFDETLSYATSSPGVNLNVTTAIEVNEGEIAYGSLIAGTDTGADNATTTIVNAGNSPLDALLIGDDMLRDGTGPEFIPASNQEFSLINFTYGSGGIAIASSSDTLANIFAPRPTGADVLDSIYWGIGVPVILSGDYTGLNTFTAALDVDVAGEW